MLADVRRHATATPARRRALKIVAVLLVLWMLASLFAWLAGPRLLVNWATGYVAREFDHRLQIGELTVNPLKLAVTVRNLALLDARAEPIVRFDEMLVDLNAGTFVRAMVVLDEFRLNGLLLNVERLEADRFNFSALAERLAVRAEAAAAAAPAADAQAGGDSGLPVQFLVKRTVISDAAFRFADHTHVPLFESWMRPINLSMDDLTSRPEREAPYDIVATIGSGGALGWRGDVSLEPLRSKGRIELRGFGLQAAYEYVRSQFAFALPAGELNARIDYVADFSGTASELRITDGSVSIDGLAITDLEERPLFAFERTQATGIIADLMHNTASVGLLETVGGQVELVVGRDGRTNIQRALLPATPSTAVARVAPVAEQQALAPPEVTPARPWRIRVAQAAIRDYRLHFVDRTTQPAVDLLLDDVDFTARELRLPDSEPVPFQLAALVGEGGALALDGNWNPVDGALQVRVAATALPLAPVAPYLGDIGRFSVLDGRLSWTGAVSARANGTEALVATGDGNLRRLALRDDTTRQRLAGLGELGIEGLRYDQARARLQLRRLLLDRLALDFIVYRNGVSNLQRVFLGEHGDDEGQPQPAPASTQAPATGKAKAPSRPLAVSLDRLELQDASVNFRDETPDLAFSAQLSRFGGQVTGLSTDPAQRAKVALEGVINRYAQLAVQGEIAPLAFEDWTQMDVRLSGLDLTALTPYTVTYIAYPLERGTLGIELDWKIAERRFEAQNRLLLDGLALGARRDAPRATRLPVKLGLALLTDSDGDADLRVPAYGELDDPKFRYGRVVLQALGNLISRAATAPFAALGSAFGGGDQAEAVVPFAPGATALTDESRARLHELAGALAGKPLLALVIAGGAAMDSDGPALQHAALDLALRREYLTGPFRRGMTVDQVTLSEAQRQELLGRLYRRATGKSLASWRPADGRTPDDADRVAAAEAVLLPGFAVDDGVLRELARMRAQAIKDLLLASGLPEERLVIAESRLLAGDAAPAAQLAIEAR